MATGLVAVLAVNGTVTYTPTTDAKVNISLSTRGTASNFRINSITSAVYGQINTDNNFSMFCAAGVAVLFTCDANVSAVISALES